MNKLTKGGIFKIAGIMLIVMLSAALIISGTLAKYRSTGTFKPQPLNVAKWSFAINNESENFFTGTMELSELHWTIQYTEEVHTINPDLELPQNNTIAPGTWGYAAITVQNIGDVDAYVTVKGVGFPTKDDVGNDIEKTINQKSRRLTFAVMTGIPDESKINGTTTYPTENSLLVRSSKDVNKSSITFYIAYKWDFGTTADGENDNLFQGNVFEFGALEITATQVEPNKGLAYSQPMPHTARPTSIVSEVMTDE